MGSNMLEREVEYFLHTLDAPITSKRITAALCPPYSPAKNAAVEKSLESLLHSNHVIKTKLHLVGDFGWKIAGPLPDDFPLCIHTLNVLKNKNVNIDYFLKHILRSFIVTSPLPVTLSGIKSYLSIKQLVDFFPKHSIEHNISLFEKTLYIKKVNVNGFGVPAWRKYNPATDTVSLPIKNENGTRQENATPKIYDPKYAEMFFDTEEHLTILRDSACSNGNYYSLKSISIRQAEILASSNLNLCFHELPEISREVAAIFAKRKAPVFFPGLKKLPDTNEHIALLKNIFYHDIYITEPDHFDLSDEIGIEVAKILANNRKGLYINGIKNISNELADIFSHHEYPNYDEMHAYFDDCNEYEYHSFIEEGLFDLRFESLEELKDCPGHIKLAKKLASQSAVHLPSLKKISLGCAVELSKHKHDLYLDGISFLPSNIASILSESECFISFLSLEELNDSEGHIKISEMLSQQRDVNLPKLVRLSRLSAAALSKTSGSIFLDSLNNVSDAAATELSKHNGFLRLPLDKPLSSSPGHIKLGIKLLDYLIFSNYEQENIEDTEDIVERKECEECEECERREEMIEKIFGEITADHLKYSNFNKINISLKNSRLSNEMAAILSNHGGKIELTRLKSLLSSKEHVSLASRLALQEKIFLPKLKKIEKNTAKAVSSAFEVCLDGLSFIDVGVASALAKNQGILSLNGLTKLQDNVALALSKHNGFLLLNGLKFFYESSSFLKLAKKLKSQDAVELESLVYISDKAAFMLCECIGAVYLPYKILGDSEGHLALRRKISSQLNNPNHHRPHLFK